MSIVSTVRESVRNEIDNNIADAVSAAVGSDKMKELIAKSLVTMIEREIDAYLNEEEKPAEVPMVTAAETEAAIAACGTQIEVEAQKDEPSQPWAQASAEQMSETSGDDFVAKLGI